MTVTYNPFEPGYIENPYPQLRLLREEDPVHHSPLDFWFLTRYGDINACLRDPDRFSVDHRNASVQMMDELGEAIIPVLLFIDAPLHTRLRRLLSQAFTPATVEGFRPRVRQLVAELLDTVEEKGELDFIGDVAYMLPFNAIGELLGIPASDRQQVLAWTSEIVKITEPVNGPDVMREISRCTTEFRAYLAALLVEKRKAPGDDVMSAMVVAEEGGDRFRDEELIDHVLLLHASAHEPTVNLLGHGILALLRHPDQAARLREDPLLDAAAVEELLRYEAPLQLTARFALEDLEIGGREIAAGSPVVMSLAAANHDPERWGPSADELVLGRPRAHEHIAFARGAHTCFGAALARLQGQEVFGPLLRRFPDLHVNGELAWNGRLNARGIVTLPVATG
jgi:cytochrome P450